MHIRMNERIDTSDNIKVEIFNTNGDKVATYKGTGFHSVSDAVNAAFDAKMNENSDREAFVYVVTDVTSGISERYRINAGGNVRLIV